jgi:hypothetical protein
MSQPPALRVAPQPLPFNASDHANHIRCFYPLSGQYGLLPRLQFYFLLVATIVINHLANIPSDQPTTGRHLDAETPPTPPATSSRRSPRSEELRIHETPASKTGLVQACRRRIQEERWVFYAAGAAAATAMTYSAIGSIQSILLLVWRQKSPFDVDVVGAYSLVSVGLVISIPLLTWSTTLRKNAGMPIVAMWAFLMFLGTVCSLVAVGTVARKAGPVDLITGGHFFEEETACYSPAGLLLTSPAQLEFDSSYGCTYKCFSAKVPSIRLAGSMVAVLESQIQDRYFTVAFVMAIVLILLTSLTMLMAPFFYRHEDRKNARRSSSRMRKIAELFYVTTCPLLCLANIVFNEIWLNRGGLPQDEKPQQVGQWSAIVETVLVVIAVEFDKWYGKRRNHKEGVRADGNMSPAGSPEIPIGIHGSGQSEEERHSMPRWLISAIGVLSLGMIMPGGNSTPNSSESPGSGSWDDNAGTESKRRERIGYFHPYVRPPRRH